MLETESSKKIAACHHEKAGNPRTCKLFGSRPGKSARPQFIEWEPA
jgi:hypothetical protein